VVSRRGEPIRRKGGAIVAPAHRIKIGLVEQKVTFRAIPCAVLCTHEILILSTTTPGSTGTSAPRMFMF
jgi:hypothetical protein